jgi:hypothetical protein
LLFLFRKYLLLVALNGTLNTHLRICIFCIGMYGAKEVIVWKEVNMLPEGVVKNIIQIFS